MRVFLPIAVLALLATDVAAQVGGPSKPQPPYELWTIDVAGGGNARRLVETPGFTCGSPDWSLDGRMIAFDTWRVGQTHDDSKIAIIRADGTGLELIGDGGMPSWSPDGTQIAYHTYRSPQTIEVMSADGNGVESVINHWGSPRWSPRGNTIASLNTDGQIRLFDLTTGRERNIFPPRYGSNFHYSANIGFAVSPDSRSYCFGASDGLFVATIADGSPPQMAWRVRDGAVRQCSWSPDGKRVVFAWTKINSNLEQLYVVDVDTNDAPTLLAGQDTSRNNSCPDWSPDGKTIVYVQQMASGSGDIRPPVSF